MHPLRLLSLATFVCACGPSASPAERAPVPKASSTVTDSTSQAATSAATPAASPDIELRLERTHYRRDEHVKGTLVNHTGETYSFNPCTRTIERKSGDSWVAVPEGQRMCTMIARLLMPNASDPVEFTLSDSLSGTVRAVITFGRERAPMGSPAVKAESQPFTIDP